MNIAASWIGWGQRDPAGMDAEFAGFPPSGCKKCCGTPRRMERIMRDEDAVLLQWCYCCRSTGKQESVFQIPFPRQRKFKHKLRRSGITSDTNIIIIRWLSFSFFFRPKMNVHFCFVFGRKWNFIFVGIFVYGQKWKMLFGRRIVYVTKRSWSWDAKSWSWTLGLVLKNCKVLVLKLRSWPWKKSWLHHCILRVTIQEAQLSMLTTGATRLAVSRGQQT